MKKQLKINHQRVHELETEWQEQLIVFGLCSTLPAYQLAYTLEKEFQLPFCVQPLFDETTTTPETTHSTEVKHQLSMWDEKELTLADSFFYGCTEDTTDLQHRLYCNTLTTGSKKKLMPNYPQIDFWWIIQGSVHDKEDYTYVLQQRIKDKKGIILCTCFTTLQTEEILFFIQ